MEEIGAFAALASVPRAWDRVGEPLQATPRCGGGSEPIQVDVERVSVHTYRGAMGASKFSTALRADGGGSPGLCPVGRASAFHVPAVAGRSGGREMPCN